MNKRLMLGAIAGLLVAANPAWGFKVNFLGTTPGKPIHENITKEALKKITVYFPNGQKGKLKLNVIERIGALASYNDEYGLDDGSLHFDDSRLEESAQRIKNFIMFAAADYGTSEEIKGFGLQWDPAFYLDIAQAMHTTQDFFAHSTWVETNSYLKAFDQYDRLEPSGGYKLPYPKFGIESNPFGIGFGFSSFVEVLDDNLNNRHNDDVDGWCSESGYDASHIQLTSAYYDYLMSEYPAHKGRDEGYSTSAWNGISSSTSSKWRGTGPTIHWPENRCVHGGDNGSGINKDHEGRAFFKQAYHSAVEASYSLMLEFLRASGATTETGRKDACDLIFDCSESTLPKANYIKMNDSLGTSTFWSFNLSDSESSSLVLGVSFNGLECNLTDKFFGNFSFSCPSIGKGDKAKGTLRIYQKVNPDFALYENDNFVANPSIAATVDTPTVNQAVSFSLTAMFDSVKEVLWKFGRTAIVVVENFAAAISQMFDTVGDVLVSATLVNIDGKKITTSITVNVKPIVEIGKDNDFNDPTLENLYDVQKIGLDTSEGTLRLPLNVGEVDATFPYIWIANSGAGTISKLATRDHYRKNPQTGEQELVKTGQELGRYRTGPGNGNPSRTTVDQEGNVWVGNRDNNTITKVGLFEFGNCVDRNGNGKIDTSTGGTDIKDWSGYFGDGQGIANAQDECILQHVALSANGVSTPSDIRMIAIDKDNNVFAGGHYQSSIFKVNGRTGEIIKAVNTNGSFYGGLIDKNGNLWAASRYYHSGRIIKVSNDLNAFELIDAGVTVYGIALDKFGKIWTTELGSSRFSAFDSVNPVETVKVFNQTGHYSAQGVATDDNGDVFIAGSSSALVGHYKQTFINGLFDTVKFVANYPVASGPTGVAVDGKGSVWSSNYEANSVSQIILAADPANAVINTFDVGYHPYNYSDMTGRTVRNITNRQGTWEAVFDSSTKDFEWKKLVWTLKQQLPEGTTVTAYAKAANNKVELSKDYKPVESDQTMTDMKGQFIKVKFSLTSANQESTPEITGIDLQ